MVRRQRSAVCGLHSHLHPVLVAWNSGPEEGSQEEVGGTDNPAVSNGAPLGWQSRVYVEIIARRLTPVPVGLPPLGLSVASSCAMRLVALRTPSSWTTCAPLFCLTCGGSCPEMSWTLPGPHPHLPCMRSVGLPWSLRDHQSTQWRGPKIMWPEESQGGSPREGSRSWAMLNELLREITQEWKGSPG